MKNNKDLHHHKTSWGRSSKWYGKIVGDKGHYYHQHVVLPWVIKTLELKTNSKLVDLGCGQGVMSRAIRQDVEYLGIDISGSLIKQAVDQNKSTKHKFVIGDISTKLEVPNNYFTHATIILALQNIKAVDKVLAQASKMLMPGGILIMIINHPCFRIPRQSGWDVDPTNKLQKRWITKYMSSMEIPISMHPSRNSSITTWSFHEPLALYSKSLLQAGFMIELIDELTSDKESVGNQAKMENRSRSEIPLFMAIKAVKK